VAPRGLKTCAPLPAAVPKTVFTPNLATMYLTVEKHHLQECDSIWFSIQEDISEKCTTGHTNVSQSKGWLAFTLHSHQSHTSEEIQYQTSTSD
jgi:hypothetical protein